MTSAHESGQQPAKSSTPRPRHWTDGRRVHGVTASGAEVVRYDTAGKWYLEHPHSGKRSQIALSEAVDLACRPGSDVRLGLSGGRTFDAKVRAEQGR